MGLPYQAALFLQELEFGGSGGRVIDLAEWRHILEKRLARGPGCRLPDVCEVQSAGKHEHVMPTEIRVRLFTGNQKKVAVRKALASVEIHFLFVEAKLAGVG